jgi:two-component system, OmpR family, sensor kinase
VTVALLAVGVASVTALRSHLTRSVDAQLRLLARDGAGSTYDRGDLPGPRLPGQFVVLILDRGGTVTVRWASQTLPDGQVPRVPRDATWIATHERQPVTVPSVDGSARWRVVVDAMPDGSLLVAAIDNGEITDPVGVVVTVELIVGAVVLSVLAVVGVVVVRAALRPLARIGTIASAIAGGDLSRRVPEPSSRTEVGRLTGALNGMLRQIEAAFRARERSEAGMRRFIADAGHELRTPVSVVQAFVEHHRQFGPLPAAELSQLIGHVEHTARRMGALVDDLLLLARLDEQRPLERQPVELLAVTADVVRDTRLTRPDRRIDLTVGGEDAYPVTGDPLRLRQVVANLVGNAVHHTPPGTPVRVRLDQVGRTTVLEVSDDGPGLTTEEAEHVFERFYRARTGHGDGSGLGLSIVASIVAAHDGTVEVRSRPGQGATFRVRLPGAW